MLHSPRAILGTSLAALFLAAPAIARSQISVLSSTVEEHQAVPGETYTGRIVISNTSTAPQTVRIYQTDYSFASDGTSNFADPGTSPRSNAAWVTPQSQQVVVPPRAEVTVPYSVKVPASDSLVGTYWSAIMVAGAESAPSSGSSAAGNAQVGIGAIIRYAVQVSTQIGNTGTRAVLFKNAMATRTPSGEAGLRLDIISSGTRATRPVLSVELYDDKGVVKGKDKAERGLLYPGTSLRQEFHFGALPPGTYKAVVFADTGDKKILATQFTISY
jgi:hypothetical protein